MTDQPMPTEGREDVPPIVEAAFVDGLRERDARGIETYGRRLQTHNGRDAGQDAWEELIDLAQYLTQLRMEHADALAEVADLTAKLDRAAEMLDTAWRDRDEARQALQQLMGTTP